MVVKAQVKTGGRGKAGGVKLAHSPEEAAEKASEILGMDIKGHTVHRVMVAQGAKIAEEFYFSVLLDRSNRNYLAMCSVEGGMEIEQLAVERPEALAKVAVDPIVGIDEAKAREIVDAAGFAEELKAPVADVIRSLWTVFTAEDATLVEVNPLVRTEDGSIIALDGKVTLDDNASEVRHPDHEALEDKESTDPLRGEGQGERPQLRQARRRGRHHRQRRRARREHARRRRVRGRGARRRQAGQLPRHRWRRERAGHGERSRRHPQRPAGQVGLRQRLRWHHRVRRGREGHRGRAFEILGDEATKPLVVRLDGNNVELGRAILREANHPLVTLAETMDGGAAKAAELANA